MNRRASTIGIAVLGMFFAALSFAASNSDALTGGIRGTVTEDGSPLSRAVVVTCTGVLTRTGAEGEFHIEGLSQAAYSLQILASGWEPVRLGDIEVKPGKTATVSAALERAAADSAIVLGNVVDADRFACMEGRRRSR